jgi:hypothetical protein
MPLAEKGARGKGRQPLSPPQHTVTPSAIALGTLLDLRALTYSPSMVPFENVNNHSTGKNQSGRLKCFQTCTCGGTHPLDRYLFRGKREPPSVARGCATRVGRG